MLTIKKDSSTIPPILILSGVIDETTDFKTLFVREGSDLRLNCKDISRINSIGIRAWQNFFGRFRESGGIVKFEQVAPALVTAAGYISDFFAPDEVESLCVPYQCVKCSDLIVKVYTPKEVMSLMPHFDGIPCEKCGATAELDEMPEEYFHFLKA